MNKMFWRNLDNPNVYYDENYKRFPLNARKSFYMLAAQLLNESKMEGDSTPLIGMKGVESNMTKSQLSKRVLDYCFKIMPDNATPYDVYTPQFIPLLLELGNKQKADEISNTMHKRAIEDLEYQTKNPAKFNYDIQTNVYILQQLYMAYKGAGQNDLANKYQKDFEKYVVSAQQEDQGSYDEE